MPWHYGGKSDGDGEGNDRGRVKDSRLRKSRRPLQIQRRIQKQIQNQRQRLPGPALRDRPLQNRWLIQIQRRRPQLRAGGTPALQGQLQRRHVCITGRSRCIASAITSVYFRAEPVLKRTTRSLGLR